jgi:hypothetical protein
MGKQAKMGGKSPPTEQKSTDWWSRGIAFSALAISILSIYFTTFYRTERLSVAVTGQPDISYFVDGFGFSGTLQLTFFNFGNTPIVIADVSTDIEQNADGDNWNTCSGNHNKTFDFNVPAFVVKPGEVEVKAFRMAADAARIKFEGASVKEDSARLLNTCFTVGFLALKRILASKNYLARWGVGKNSIPVPSGHQYEPFVLVDRVIPLFYLTDEPILFERN